MGKKQRQRKNGSLSRTPAQHGLARGSLCPYCGKKAYQTRKQAREANKQYHPGENLSAYKCLRAPDWVDTSSMWHLGHLAPAVTREGRARAQVHAPVALRKKLLADKVPDSKESCAIVISSTDQDKDEDRGQESGPKEGFMPTISQLATINLQGFDRDKGKYRLVDGSSDMSDRLALVHGALRAYALTHNFEEMEHGGHKGFVGRVNVSALIRELFAQDVDDEEKVKALAKSIQNGGTKAGLIRCMDADGRLQGADPIWWVAASYEDVKGHAPFEKAPRQQAQPKKREAKATTKRPSGTPAKKGQRRRRKPPQATLDRMYRVKSVLEDVGTKYDTALTYAEIQAELKAMGVEASYGQVETAVDLLVAEKQAVTRQMSAEDKAAIRAAGGDAPGGIPRVLVMLRRGLDKQGNIPVLLGTLEQIRATENEKALQEDVEQPLEAPEPIVEEAAAPKLEEPEERAERQTVEALQEMYAATLSKADRLQAENDRLRKAVDGLLATIEILKG